MTAMSDVLENAVLDLLLRNTSLTASGINTGIFYAALFLSSPTDANSGSEIGISGTGYKRTQILGFNTANNGSTSNNTSVVFDNATADWGTVTHFGIFDSPTGGNLLFHGTLTTPKVISAGDSFVFPVGNITISID